MTPGQFRQAREFLGLEIRWLAAHLGVTVRQLNRWENGIWPVPERAAAELAALLDEYVPVWRCSHCGKGFKTYRSAHAHTERHSGEIIWPGLPFAPEVQA